MADWGQWKGTTVRVEFGDGTTAVDHSSSHVISRAFPHTYGLPLAHFLRATAKVPDAQIITEHPVMRVGVVFSGRQSLEDIMCFGVFIMPLKPTIRTVFCLGSLSFILPDSLSVEMILDQILRNLSVEEQQNLYMELGNIFQERHLAGS